MILKDFIDSNFAKYIYFNRSQNTRINSNIPTATVSPTTPSRFTAHQPQQQTSFIESQQHGNPLLPQSRSYNGHRLMAGNLPPTNHHMRARPRDHFSRRMTKWKGGCFSDWSKLKIWGVIMTVISIVLLAVLAVLLGVFIYFYIIICNGYLGELF